MDLSEKGVSADGTPETLDKRLFVQLQVFDIEPAAGPRAMVSALSRRLREKGIHGVIYADANDHRGIGLLTWAEDPGQLLDTVHPLLGGKRFSALTPRPGWAMLGRTYASGHEQGLEHWLLARPRDHILRGDLTWAVWYPLRRNGEFNLLDGKAKGEVLREHGTIGKSYGDADLVHDVRLACHGMDAEDNDFVIGLTAASLHPISHVVQAMRGTAQTARYIEKMGPFFVGRKIWQNPEPAFEEPEVTEPADDGEDKASAETEAQEAVEAVEPVGASTDSAEPVEEPSAEDEG